jgi:hypothetical protein
MVHVCCRIRKADTPDLTAPAHLCRFGRSGNGGSPTISSKRLRASSPARLSRMAAVRSA